MDIASNYVPENYLCWTELKSDDEKEREITEKKKRKEYSKKEKRQKDCEDWVNVSYDKERKKLTQSFLKETTDKKGINVRSSDGNWIRNELSQAHELLDKQQLNPDNDQGKGELPVINVSSSKRSHEINSDQCKSNVSDSKREQNEIQENEKSSSWVSVEVAEINGGKFHENISRNDELHQQGHRTLKLNDRISQQVVQSEIPPKNDLQRDHEDLIKNKISNRKCTDSKQNDNLTQENDDKLQETDNKTEGNHIISQENDKISRERDKIPELSDKMTRQSVNILQQNDEKLEGNKEISQISNKFPQKNGELQHHKYEVNQHNDERLKQNDAVNQQYGEKLQQNDEKLPQNDEKLQQNDEKLQQNDEKLPQNDEKLQQNGAVNQQYGEKLIQNDEKLQQNDEKRDQNDGIMQLYAEKLQHNGEKPHQYDEKVKENEIKPEENHEIAQQLDKLSKQHHDLHHQNDNALQQDDDLPQQNDEKREGGDEKAQQSEDLPQQDEITPDVKGETKEIVEWTVPMVLHGDSKIPPLLSQLIQYIKHPIKVVPENIVTEKSNNIVVPTVAASRFGSDLLAAFNKSKLDIRIQPLVILFHHIAPHVSRSSMSSRDRLSDRHLAGRCREIIDVVYWMGKIYKCQVNHTAICKLKTFYNING